MNPLVDVHAHLELIDDCADAIRRAEQAGVVSVIANGMDTSSNRQVLGFSNKFKIVKPAIGLYPADAVTLSDEEINRELGFIRSKENEIIALGEIGLEGKRLEEGMQQRAKGIFVKLLRLAIEIRKPVIVHSRGLEAECISLLEEMKAKRVVLHCFCGGIELARKAERLGFMLSIPCSISRDKYFQSLAREISLSHLLTETDSPFLGPKSGMKSEPAMVKRTIERIAELKGMEEGEVANNIYANYGRVFENGKSNNP
ncbi:hypothetical protein COT48_05910 [Candidatus Woesearchaeota archaeon CG08_land_8_20_14_0_20_47_9]|nr:MAG: hypothetical protein COT48_05910 [Candidatus Woesearchaeota archaeon CG08_land_8_20_14_0_20_47_9]HII29599.1 TatD family hydrolase [Candidatus Woesearchaeota archaeon]